jgi:hypothetical protein
MNLSCDPRVIKEIRQQKQNHPEFTASLNFVIKADNHVYFYELHFYALV